MESEAKTKTTIQQRAIHESKEFVILSAYLYVTLGAVILLKTAVLRSHGIDAALWGVAIVKALLLAKFMLIGNAMKLGERYAARPLIWPIIHKAFAFLVLLVVLTMAEEVVVGWLHGRPAVASLSDLFGPRLTETAASILILLLVLIPYFAFRVLSDALGEGKLLRLLFVEHASDRAR